MEMNKRDKEKIENRAREYADLVINMSGVVIDSEGVDPEFKAMMVESVRKSLEMGYIQGATDIYRYAFSRSNSADA